MDDEASERDEAMINRILWNRRPKNPYDGGEIDEIVASKVNVHIEQMNDGVWWIALYNPDNPDEYWMGNFVAGARKTMTFKEQEDAAFTWERDEEHGKQD